MFYFIKFIVHFKANQWHNNMTIPTCSHKVVTESPLRLCYTTPLATWFSKTMDIYKGTTVDLGRSNTFKTPTQEVLSNTSENVLRCKMMSHPFPICYFTRLWLSLSGKNSIKLTGLSTDYSFFFFLTK